MTTVAGALSEGTALLRAHGASSRSDALLLLENALGRARSWIVAHGDALVSPETAARFLSSCQRRKAGIPAAYILGSAGFYGRDFLVDESVLIPRPETEHLVDEAIAFIGSASLAVLDVGTGCGAIACSVAAETQACVHATDISTRALEIARENACRHHVLNRCEFHHGDLTGPVRGRSFHVAVANLPYVPTADLPRPPDSVAFEPREALDGGGDGLQLYRRLLVGLPPMLSARALVLLEAAPPTMAGLVEMTKRSLPDFTVAVCRDYAGLERYVRAERGGLRRVSVRGSK